MTLRICMLTINCQLLFHFLPIIVLQCWLKDDFSLKLYRCTNTLFWSKKLFMNCECCPVQGLKFDSYWLEVSIEIKNGVINSQWRRRSIPMPLVHVNVKIKADINDDEQDSNHYFCFCNFLYPSLCKEDTIFYRKTSPCLKDIY